MTSTGALSRLAHAATTATDDGLPNAKRVYSERALAGLRLGAIALVIGIAAGCQADFTVSIDVAADGTGEIAVLVELDRAAVEALGGDVESQLRLADLDAAGWRIETETVVGGALEIEAARPVTDRRLWQSALDQIAGPGVFKDVEATSTSSFAKQQNNFSALVTLTGGAGIVSDPEMTALLGGEPLGVPADELFDGRALDELAKVTINANSASSDGPGVSQSFRVRFDDPQPTRIIARSSAEHLSAQIVRSVAWAFTSLTILAATLALLGLLIERQAESRADADREISAYDDSGFASNSDGSGLSPTQPKATGSVRMIVLDPLTVLYDYADPLDNYVLPFVRHNGSDAPAEEVTVAHERVRAGQLGAAEFWKACGMRSDPAAIDEVFVQMRQLRPSAANFLREMQRLRIPVAGLTDDGLHWSTLTRERDSLSSIWPWLVSAEVGVAKDDLAMFEKLRRETGVAYEYCLFIDTSVDSLDTAKTLGMKTTLFETPETPLSQQIQHARVRSFSDFFKRRL